MSKLPPQVLNHFVSLMIKLDLGSSQMVRTRNVFSAVKRQRGGLCLEGVSTPSVSIWGLMLIRRLLDIRSIVGRVYHAFHPLSRIATVFNTQARGIRGGLRRLLSRLCAPSSGSVTASHRRPVHPVRVWLGGRP